jgi:hypothetical protein
MVGNVFGHHTASITCVEKIVRLRAMKLNALSAEFLRYQMKKA